MLLKSDLVAAPVFDRWESRYGAAADQWLENAWQKLHSLIRPWGLSSLEELRGGSESIVVAAKRAGDDVVIKLIPPWQVFPASEATALRAWGGRSSPRLIDVDGSTILMEKICPGSPSGGQDLEEIARLVRSLTVSVRPIGLPDLSSAIVARFDRARENRHGLIAPEDLERAASAAISLATAPVRLESVGLVHGDLLSKNILFSADKGLVAIDPLASWGERSFDVALWSVTEEPVHDSFSRAEALAHILDFDVDHVLKWIPLLLTAEACLASYERAHHSAKILRSLTRS